MKQIAFITGATSGIGKATAQLLAKNNFQLIVCGRRKEKLDELIEELKTDTEIFSLQFDVSKKEEVTKAISSLPNEFQKIDVLINNAGNAHGLNSIQEGSLDDWDAMIDSNLKGLLYVSRAIIPKMVAQNKGFIVNIGSIAAKDVYANGNVYCATKHAVDALNKAMRIDLNKYNIRVSGIHPGAVNTEFSKVRFKGDMNKADAVYKGFNALKAKDIADIIHFVITRPYHVNIEDLVVYPTAQATPTVVNKKE
jgi:NADP-dependent 3-hydroxy acid dehydrogenase YdfG